MKITTNQINLITELCEELIVMIEKKQGVE